MFLSQSCSHPFYRFILHLKIFTEIFYPLFLLYFPLLFMLYSGSIQLEYGINDTMTLTDKFILVKVAPSEKIKRSHNNKHLLTHHCTCTQYQMSNCYLLLLQFVSNFMCQHVLKYHCPPIITAHATTYGIVI